MRKRKCGIIILGVWLLLALTGCGDTKETARAEEAEMTENTIEEEETTAAEVETETQNAEKEITSSQSVLRESDTITWFNAAGAVLIYLNGWDYRIYGGIPEGETSALISQQLLDGSWGVSDRESAKDTMEWLLSSGHNASLLKDLAHFEEEGLGEVAREDRAVFLYENWDISEEMAKLYAKCYELYEAGEEDIIIGWDYSRASNLFSWYYLAGYYTREEALDGSLAAAREIQQHFDSWDEFMDSYFLGYEYWAEESSGERQLVYRMLRSMEDGPYRVDWNLDLEKSW